VIGLVLITLGLNAQPKHESEREEMYRRYLDFPKYVKGGTIEPHWMADGNSFWYSESDEPGAPLWRVDPGRNTKTRIQQPVSKPRPTQEPDGQPSPDGSWIAFKRDFNLFLRSSDGEQTIQLTEDGTEKVQWQSRHLVWAPDGSKLAARRDDYTDVPCYPLIDWLKIPVVVKCNVDTISGLPWPRTELFIFDTKSRARLRVNTNPERYLAWNVEPHWRRDSLELIFLTRDRVAARQGVAAANARTGRTRLILEEKGCRVATVVANRRRTRKYTPLGDDSGFIWLSEQDGWNHVYLYDYEGKLIRRLTRGEFPVLRVVEVDSERRWVYFTGHDDRTRVYDTHLYRVSLDGGEHVRLTDATGDHDVTFSPSKEFFLDTHSSVTRPPVVELRRADGQLLQVLTKADVSALEQLHRQPPEEFAVKAADGETDLYGVLYKPYDFDSRRKYPVIDFTYAGPYRAAQQRTFVHWQWEGPRFSQRWAHPDAYAQLGFITFVVDARGTPERGRRFQEVAVGNIGRHEIPDHAAALKQLAEERPYMDLERVGTFGWSWGGHFAMRALLQAPEVYHVGVAQSAGGDLSYSPGAAIESFLGMEQDNPAAYEYGSNLWLADRLEGKLLIIEQTNDINSLMSAAMRMIDALIKAGKRFDLILLPGEAHVPSERVQPYLGKAIRGYFQEHLKP
jgi:dipeptidyl aminopeptidase/acylaminoacyl peptidase